ncbi:MAG: hypothetical protein HFI40_01840 [Lachnospiraceae bacterium]|nr:hypothetical protein [Lachnospiraceae bacterium]
MKWMNGALFCGTLALLFFLVSGIRYKSLEEQYLDRIWLDEELSVAARDAVRDCLSCLEPDTSLYPEPVWERFLLAYQAFGGREEGGVLAEFPAAVLAVREGMYQYDRKQGWSPLLPWETDRIRQITIWLCACMDADRRSLSKGIPYEIRLPYTDQEEWARAPGENCLIVLYEGEGREAADNSYYRLAIGGAQYRKRTLWYVQRGNDSWSWYHREGCLRLLPGLKQEVYYTIEECAWRGALPCPACVN